MINKDNVVFLLGGYDLEMLEIKKVLDKAKVKYFDEKLTWETAKLSAYEDKLNKQTIYYAIELNMDLKGYDNIKVIDHHNELSANDASILQVLKLLGKSPTREQELIAANDVGHIKGMESICATKDEIISIRSRDRQAQGVTKEEEQIAKEEILTVDRSSPVHVIKSSLRTFTPITDFYDTRPLLIFNDKVIMYYGDISKLKETYKKEIKNKDAFHGKKYFGFTVEYLENKNIDSFVTHIIDLHDKSEFISYHSFMFPFSFNKNNTEKKDFESRIKIDNEFAKKLDAEGWHYKKYDLSTIGDTRAYNEYAYYHKPVREMLYNFSDTFEEGETSYYFSKEVKNAKYTISLIDATEPYELKLTDVYLRLFETGIGVLVFETENHKYSNFDDILKINDYGRRVYPPFLDDKCEQYTLKTKKAFLADKIEIKLDMKSEPIVEKFHTEYKKKIPKDIIIGNHIMEVLGKTLFSQNTKNYCQITPILDDRMFLVSYAENETLMKCLQRNDENFEKNDDWYKYLFVDGKDKTVQYLPMQKELTKASTYPRWLGWGTMWGITPYSFVALTTSGGRDMILPHTQYIYHQMAIIILAIEASLARFNDEVSRLSNLRKEGDELEERVQILNEYYIKFINKLHFRELTSQEQGKELFNIAKKVTCFEEELKELDNEISELHHYVAMKNEKETAKNMNTLTQLGAIFLPLSFMATVLGLGIFNYDGIGHEAIGVLLVLLLSGLIGLSFSKPKGSVVRFSILFAILLSILGYLFYANADVKADTSPQKVQVVQYIHDTTPHKGVKDVTNR